MQVGYIGFEGQIPWHREQLPGTSSCEKDKHCRNKQTDIAYTKSVVSLLSHFQFMGYYKHGFNFTCQGYART
jgi:hypothetical protein